MKCKYCDEKSEIMLKRFRDHSKVPYCRTCWKMLCLQETIKLFKMNQWSLEDFGKFADENFTVAEFFEQMTKH